MSHASASSCSGSIYTSAGESGCAAAEVAEAEIIEAYLPKPLTELDVVTIIDEEVATLKAAVQELGMRQMGLVMKPVTARVAGRYGGKKVSELVRARLS